MAMRHQQTQARSHLREEQQRSDVLLGLALCHRLHSLLHLQSCALCTRTRASWHLSAKRADMPAAMHRVLGGSGRQIVCHMVLVRWSCTFLLRTSTDALHQLSNTSSEQHAMQGGELVGCLAQQNFCGALSHGWPAQASPCVDALLNLDAGQTLQTDDMHESGSILSHPWCPLRQTRWVDWLSQALPLKPSPIQAASESALLNTLSAS